VHPIVSATWRRVSGLQVRDAVAEEALLLLDDLAGDLDDGPRPLVERLEQPVGALQAFVEPGLGLAVLRPLASSL
jgi:hypothetical protein